MRHETIKYHPQSSFRVGLKEEGIFRSPNQEKNNCNCVETNI